MIWHKLLAWMASPVLFKTMESRIGSLMLAYQGFERTGVPLVIFDGQRILPAGLADDVGLYYLIPKLMFHFHWSVQTALLAFWGTVIAAAVTLGLTGMWLLFHRRTSRAVALAGVIAAAFLCVLSWDVYIAPGAVEIALVPLLLYFLWQERSSPLIVAFYFFSGLLISAADIVRSHAGTPVLLMMLFATIFIYRKKIPRCALLMLVLAAGLFLPRHFFRSVIAQRDAYLASAGGETLAFENRHPLWHSIYLGLGYLKNPYGLAYSDEIAFNKSRTILGQANPTLTDHDRIMKEETVKFVKAHPFFVLKTIVAKAALILAYLLIFANIGLASAFLAPKPFGIEAGFAAALGFSSLFGLLVIPHPKYMLGFIVLSCLYGVVSTAFAVEKGRFIRFWPSGRI